MTHLLGRPHAETAKAPDPLSAYVHLGYGFDAARYQVLYEQDLVPDRVPYGFHHAEEQGAAVTYSVDHAESRLVQFFRRGLQKLLGFDLVHAYRNRASIHSADIVWTMEERQSLAVLFWVYVLPSLRHKKVIGQTVWLYDQWSNTSRLKRRLLGCLLRRAAALTVHSRNYVAMPELIAASIHTQLLPFGISQDSFPLTSQFRERHTPIRILSMGTDPTRDWATLLAAFGNDDRFEVVVITRALTDSALSAYSNVTARRQPTMETFRDCYRWADYVVIPMSKNLYSGITVALEATSMGVPVVSTATGGVPTYFNESEVLYVPPEDPIAIRTTVLTCLDEQRRSLVERAQRRFTMEDYSSRGMAQRYVHLSRGILSAQTAPRSQPGTTDPDSYRAPLSHQAR